MLKSFMVSELNITTQLCSVADQDPSDPYVLVILDPDPDPLVRGMDLDPVPDHSITKPK
jgi:hypothetical protein